MDRYSGQDWNSIIQHLPGAHLLQTKQWADLKSRYGWSQSYFVWRNEVGVVVAAALILMRSLRMGVKILYIPRGPMLDWSDNQLRNLVLDDIQLYAKSLKAVFIKMDPEVILGTGSPWEKLADNENASIITKDLLNRKWTLSTEQVQFRNSIWLNLDGTPETWLGRMKQKTRYNLRLAEKKGVVVRLGGKEDFRDLYRMYAETSVRDGFVIRPESYYTHVWSEFMGMDMAVPIIAEYDHQAIAAIFLFWFGNRAWYLYGMSTLLHRDKMPNYLLQWEAMRLAKEKGCGTYDLWGAPDTFDESDPMWGVYRFKEGLGGDVVRMIGAWDFPVNTFFYKLYVKILPEILNLMRKKGKNKTRMEVSG